MRVKFDVSVLVTGQFGKYVELHMTQKEPDHARDFDVLRHHHPAITARNLHHHLPHIHARYVEFEATIGIDEGEILAGELPRKQLRLVQAWIELHRDELLADLALTANGELPY